MLKKTKIKVGFISALVAMIAAFSVTATVAWFGKASVINTNLLDGIDGTVLTSYFHCGNGTEENPFVITRPKHWENLVWLHNNIEGFYNANNPSQGIDGKGYYFQVGYDLDEDGDLEVYDYKDDGTPNFDASSPTYSQNLNLACYSLEGEELIPIGSPQRPFIGEMNGNNIKLSGFKVVAIDADNDDFQLEDIGIFGYVGPSAYVHDIYFSDYTINTNGAKIHDETQYELHTPHLLDGSSFPYPCIGSLAGHIMVAESFENVYTNRCTIEGTSADSQEKLDNYSYYGVVEIPTEGGHVGPGSNYNFVFDSAAVYNYMSRNYSNISNNPMRARNTEYANTLVHENEFNPDKSTKTPFSNGYKYITSGLNSYNLIGDDPDDYSTQNPYTGYNYSLSTIGYQPLSPESKTYTYTAITKDGLQSPSEYASVTDKTFEQTKVTNSSFNGYNIAWDPAQSKWTYYHIETEPVDPRTGGTITITIPEAIRMTCSGINLSSSLDDDGTTAVLYIDQTPYELSSSDFSYTYGAEGSHGLFRLPSDPYLQINSFTKKITNLTLGIGTHHLALVFNHKSSGNTQCKNIWIAYATSVNTDSDNSRLNITPKGFELDQHATDNFNYTWTITNNDCVKNYYGSVNRNCNNINIQSQPFSESDKKPYIISDGWNKILIGLDETNDTYHELDDPDYKFAYDDGVDQQLLKIKHNDKGEIIYDSKTGFPIGDDGTEKGYVPQNVSEIVMGKDDDGNPIPVNILRITVVRTPKWIATYEAPKALAMHDIVDARGDGICDVCGKHYNTGETSHADAPVYIADDPILTESGYSADNIDIVGGGFQFSNTFVTIDGEDNRALTSPLTASDIGKKWYATEHAANSIVLYLSNVGGLNDIDVMGNIKFHYSWTLTPILGVNFKSMVFKKGGRTNGYVYMNNNLAMQEGDFVEEPEPGGGALDNMITMTLRRGIVKKCAFAALDGNGNILCGYDSNGNQVGYTGEIKENRIKTYVLLVGVKNNITFLGINTRISKIEFEYLAPQGFGGSFGSVGYRDPFDKLEFTVLNFYFLVPAGDKFRITVSYSGPANPSEGNKGRYDVTFLYYTTSGEKLNVLFYLYDIQNYEVYCNGVPIAETGNAEVNIESSTWS